MNHEPALYQDLESVLFSEAQLKEAVQKLGERISTDYAGKNPLLICILKGASVFFADLIREIDLPLEIEFMAISSYGASTVSSGEVRMIKDLDRSILGRDVLIVEDIVDSGMTLSYLKRTLLGRGASSLKLAALLDKPSRRRVPLTVDYSCFEIPDAFVVGYGLDYDEKYRNLPLVGILDPKIYTK
ncbi:MAG: hypoxanthine phosphoribosyltransferase [Eubacteriales bacterium]|nr:hypoxanthine phosphoribosyltransferase [Eubacteriales bacterium]